MISISQVTDVLSDNVDAVLSWDKIEKIVRDLHELEDGCRPKPADESESRAWGDRPLPNREGANGRTLQ